MYLRDKMFNKMNKNPTDDNNFLYCKFRNRVVAEQRNNKIKYYKEYFEKYINKYENALERNQVNCKC